MIPVRILSDHDVKKILDIRNTIHCVENAYVLKAKNQARLLPLISEDLFPGNADLDIKSGISNFEDVFGLKLVSWFGNNEKMGLPALTGFVMLFDLKNGFPKALINARYLTGMRTGAAGAIGIKHLAKPASEVLLVAGTGVQAVFQIAAALSEIRTTKKVLIFNPLRYESAVKFHCCIKTELGKILNDANDLSNIRWMQHIESIEFIAVDSLISALEETDAVITVTPSRQAFILNDWVRPGTHFSCVGADMPGKQEISEKIFDGAIVFVDDITQASTVGETQSALKKGIIDQGNVTEIGHLILGNTKGRLSGKDITIFDSTGIALQDLSVAKFLVSRAEEMNLGTIVHM